MPTATAEGLHISNLNAALRALSRIDKNLSGELRDASTEIADHVLTAARSRAQGRRAQAVAGSMRVRRDRIPSIAAGGSVPVQLTGRSVPAGAVFWGTEFGGTYQTQFEPHRGRSGYFLYPAVRAEGGWITDTYLDALDVVLSKAAREGSH